MKVLLDRDSSSAFAINALFGLLGLFRSLLFALCSLIFEVFNFQFSI